MEQASSKPLTQLEKYLAKLLGSENIPSFFYKIQQEEMAKPYSKRITTPRTKRARAAARKKQLQADAPEDLSSDVDSGDEQPKKKRRVSRRLLAAQSKLASPTPAEMQSEEREGEEEEEEEKKEEEEGGEEEGEEEEEEEEQLGAAPQRAVLKRKSEALTSDDDFDPKENEEEEDDDNDDEDDNADEGIKEEEEDEDDDNDNDGEQRPVVRRQRRAPKQRVPVNPPWPGHQEARRLFAFCEFGDETPRYTSYKVFGAAHGTDGNNATQYVKLAVKKWQPQWPEAQKKALWGECKKVVAARRKEARKKK